MLPALIDSLIDFYVVVSQRRNTDQLSLFFKPYIQFVYGFAIGTVFLSDFKSVTITCAEEWIYVYVYAFIRLCI